MNKYLIIIFAYILCANNCVIDCNFTTKPNIIVLLADDQGWYDVVFHGTKHMSTPNIDTLAADGIVLNRYYTQPMCTPSRGALLTGILPIHSGTQHGVILNNQPWGLPLNQSILPHYLKQLGYSTHAVGKWGLGFFCDKYLPTLRGFDSHTGYWTEGEDYFTHQSENGNQSALDFRHNRDTIYNASGIYSTDYFTERALKVIESHNRNDSLFLYMAYQSVHSPNFDPYQEAPALLTERFNYIKDENRRKFAANLYSMDLSIGKIFKKLFERKLLENSIVVYMSDNGGAVTGGTKNFASNYPLKGEKITLWEGGVRVPALIWSPLLTNYSYVYDCYTQVVDWIPTLLTAIDSNYANNYSHVFDGKSFWNQLFDNKCHSKPLLLNIDYIYNNSAIINNGWKLIQGMLPTDAGIPDQNLRSPSYNSDNITAQTSNKIIKERLNSSVYKVLRKLNRKPNYDFLINSVVNCGNHSKHTKCDLNNEICLFHLKSDPCEYNNLAHKYPNMVNTLWKQILNYNKTAIPSGVKPGDPRADPIYHNNTWDVWVENC